jgi:hypothetical protein
MTQPSPTLSVTWNTMYGYAFFDARNVPAGYTIKRVDVVTPPQLVEVIGYANGAWAASGSGLGEDYRTPIGERVTYVLAPITSYVDDASYVRAAIDVPGNQAWLRDVANPVLSLQVIVVDTGEEQRDAYQNVYEISGRMLPLVVHDIRLSRRGTVTLFVPDRYTRTKIDVLLDTGDPLLLNVCSDLLWTPCYMAIGTATYARYGNRDRWTLALEYVEVDDPRVLFGDILTPRPTWQDVHNGLPAKPGDPTPPPSWQFVKDIYQDWLAVVLAERK